jgi:hypothetical protein
MTISPLPKKLSSNVLEAGALTTSGLAFFLELGFLPILAPLWLYLGWDLVKRFRKQPQPQIVIPFRSTGATHRSTKALLTLCSGFQGPEQSVRIGGINCNLTS